MCLNLTFLMGPKEICLFAKEVLVTVRQRHMNLCVTWQHLEKKSLHEHTSTLDNGHTWIHPRHFLDDLNTRGVM